MSWEPTVETGVWGRLQVVINDTDITFFRDVPVEIQSWSSGDPFDDASCVLHFSQISPFEKFGTGPLSWLIGHASVDINLIRPNDSTKVIWEGMVASIDEDLSDTATGVSVQCIGALYQLDYYVRAPKNYDEGQERLYEHAIRDEFYPPSYEREAMKTGPLRIDYPDGMEDTKFETRYSGAWDRTLTGYIQRLLADMVHEPGFIREPGTPEIPGEPGSNAVQEIVLDPEPPPWPWGSSYPSASLNGTFQLTFRGQSTPDRQSTGALKWDATASQVKAALENLSTIDEVTVTGSGTSASPWRVTFVGSRVRQRKQPRISSSHTDLRHTHSTTSVTIIQAGEEGAPATPAVPASDPEPWVGSWTLLKDAGRVPVLQLRNESTRHWTVSLGAPGVSHSLKSDYSQTPNVFYGEGTDEAATTWRNSTVDIGEGEDEGKTTAHHYPIAWDESTYPAVKKLSESGEPTDPPPAAYSTENVRIEVIQRYGAGVSLLDARRSATQQLEREVEPGWFGTITLETDPEEGSRFEIKAGSNLLLRHFKVMPPPKLVIFEELKDRDIFLDPFYTVPMLRGQFCSVVVRTLEDAGVTVPSTGSSPFTDVAGNTHANAINRLAALGIAQGYPDGTFKPNDRILRDQMTAIVHRTAEWATGTTIRATYNHFNDSDGSLDIFRQIINAAIENDLVTMEANGSFYPREPANRLDAGESMYLLNHFLGGDMLEDFEGLFVHIAQVETNFERGTVDLTVDSKMRSLATLAQLIERSKSENKNPAKMLMVNRESGQTDDTKFPWDYTAGSGSLPKKAMTTRVSRLPVPTPPDESRDEYFVYVNGANSEPWRRWVVTAVVAAGKGSISRSEVRAYDGSGKPLAIPFLVGVYSEFVTEYSMPRNPYEPDAFKQPADSEERLSGYDPYAVALWGQGGQRAGYWPGTETEGDPVSGIFIDHATFQFQLPEGENSFWVAIYAEENAWFQGRFHHGVQ